MNAIRFLVLLVALLFALGCTKDRVGTAAEALDAGSTTTIARLANTPSAIVSRSFLTVGYTLRGSPQVAWARSQNGTSWTTCNVNNPSVCNGANPTPKVPGQLNWIGNGAMASMADGHVVYVVLGDSDGNTATAEQVIALVSANDGQWFTASQLVNEAGGDCDPALEDAPDVTFDMTTTPPTVWVVWRHKSQSSFGGCVRRGQISGTTIQWLDKVRSVGGMDRENNFDPSMGQGGLRIVAGDGVVSVGYSNDDELKTCPDQTLISMAWEVTSTIDNGATWTENLSGSPSGRTSRVYHADYFSSCPFGTVQNGNRNFDFIRSSDGNYYFAVADWTSGGGDAIMHLFMSEANGFGFEGQSLSWREFCPGYQDTPDGGPIAGGPASNWTRPGVVCPNLPPPLPVAHALMFPTLGFDGLNRLGLTFAMAPNPTDFFVAYEGNIAPRTASASFQILSPVSPSWSPSGGVMLQHFSLLGWSQPSATPCTSSGPFEAFWVSGSTSPTLFVRQITL